MLLHLFLCLCTSCTFGIDDCPSPVFTVSRKPCAANVLSMIGTKYFADLLVVKATIEYREY